ncbi:MAG TPA: LytTR family DNA-binding domain-containing protein [Candidatus Polarisedimenticolia bacterium]|nr:LytTR family DNA-binding domain-containing protein [Candidatus Polarisedimenticolia bacterium]
MSGRIRFLIVDDEPLAREAIRSLAAADPELEIAGEAGDGNAAIQAIEALRPDLLFLDVQMPEVDGFEVLEELSARGGKLPVTVFVTAHDQHALRAFEAHAFDYLLKPIHEARFRESVSAAKARIAADSGRDAAERLGRLLAENAMTSRRPRRLSVKGNGRISLVSVDEIEWIESEGNYVRLHLSGQSHLLRETMNGIESRLDPEHFMRIHRSAIVNVNFIQELRPWFTGEYIVRMRSGKELTLTRSHRDALRRLIGDDRALPPQDSHS